MSRSNPVKRLKNGAAGYLTSDENPLSQSSSAAFLLFIVLAISGAILFLFYPATFPENYETIARFEKENLLAALMRGIHSHAADLVLLFVIIHFVRVTFGSRGRARSLFGARMAGGALLLFILAQAATGSVLPMNEKSGAIIMMATEKLSLPDAISSAFAISDKVPGSAIVYLLALHLIPPFIAIGLLYYHFEKIKKPRLFPKPLFLSGLIAGIVIAAFFKSESLGIADFSTIPGKTSFDWLLLFPLAFISILEPAFFWPLALGALFLLFLALGWPSLKGSEQVVSLEEDKCVGCSLCQIDCPYNAIEMEVTPPDKKHPLLAVIDKEGCTGCAVCIGSCSFDALTMAGEEGNRVSSEVEIFFEENKDEAKVLALACKNSYDIDSLNNNLLTDSVTKVIPLRCGGELLARSIEKASETSTHSVIVAVCPESECYGRYGSTYTEERLSHKRKPWLRKKNVAGDLALYEGDTKGLAEVLRLAQNEGRAETENQAFNSGKGLIASAVTVALIALLTAGTSLGLETVWSKTGFALNNREEAQIALLVTSYSDVEVLVTAGNRTIFKEELNPQKPLEEVTLFRRFVAPEDKSEVVVTVSEESRGTNETLSIKTPLSAGRIIVVRYDHERGVLEALNMR